MKNKLRKIKFKKNPLSYIIIAVFCFILISLMSTNVSFSKFITGANLFSTTRVAQIVINVIETEGKTNDTELLYRDSKYSYYFTVTNKKDEQVSEVICEYFIKIDAVENYIDENGDNAYQLYRIEEDGITLTPVNMNNNISAVASILGFKTTNGNNETTINENAQNYVLEYYPISTTSNTSGENLFTVKVIASQLEE